MKKLFLLFALVLTVGMNAWAADYVAYDYLNDVVCTTDQAYTRIYKEPTLEDPSFAIFMFIKDSGNGKKCVTWGGYENKDANILPKILIDGVDLAQPGWEMCWLNTNPDRDVDTWWDTENDKASIYTKEINGVTWTLRFNDVQRYDSRYYFVKMYFCPSEIEGGSKHTITVKGRLTEYVGENTPSTTNYLDVERDFVFDMPKLITSDPIVAKENTNEKALSFYGNLAAGAVKSTYFGVYVNDGTVNGFKPYDQLDGKQELAYATTFSNIKYTIPEKFEGKDLRGQMHRDFTGLLGGKVSVCHYYGRFNAAANAIHYEAKEPTSRTVGNVEYWEYIANGRFYSDGACTKESTKARLLRYAKLRSNPITYLEEGGSSAENKTYEGVPFNWVAGGPFDPGATSLVGTKRHVEFTVIGTDVADARLKLYLSVDFCTSYYIRIFVNGTEKHKKLYGNTDDENFDGYKPKAYIDAYPLEGLKTGDVVCLEVEKYNEGIIGESYYDACIEYTSSNGGAINITVRADEKLKAYGTTQDPELTYSVFKSGEAADINLSGINLIREEGEELGEYAIHISQDEGANQEYYITFVDGKFRILDVVHHPKTAPEYTTTGYSQDCWEEKATGKFYTYDINMQELSPAQVITYKKHISNPVTANIGFTIKDATYSGVQFNWAAETTYKKSDKGTRYVEFTVYGSDTDNARLKWTKTTPDWHNGQFTITVYVNGKQKYSVNQDGRQSLSGIFVVPLKGLKIGDIVKFEVKKPNASYWDDPVMIATCLEYTSSNGGCGITIKADDIQKQKGDGDPELTWSITGMLAEGDKLTDINIWREEGEEAGRYPIHVSQKEGANPKYYIRFVDGTFTVNEVVHHEVTEPTHRTIGYSKECWEDIIPGKFYSDAKCTKELTPAQVIAYKKLTSNPVTSKPGFGLKEDATYEGVQFNWAAETSYNTYDTGTRYVEFTVYGTDVDNARVKWTKDNNYRDPYYGLFTITIYVNGKSVYSVIQGKYDSLSGLFAVPLPKLKYGDIVKFEVGRAYQAGKAGQPKIAACLEYTSSNGGLNGMLITANQDPDHTENYYSTFWSSTAAYQVPEGVTAYTGKVEDSTSEPNTSVLKLTAIEDGIIPASQGVILRMTTEDNSATKQQIALAKTTATGTWSGTNALTGTDEATTLGANQYALSLGQNGVGFYLWEDKEIGAHKAYLTLPSSFGAKAFIFQFDNGETTGILKPVMDEKNDGPAYNLNGMRVNDGYKGIVIKNGKKIYQK